MQALSLLLAVLLRAMVPARRVDYDSDEDFIVARRPHLSPQSGTTYPTTSGDSKGFHSDFWSSQLRQKVLHCFRLKIFPCLSGILLIMVQALCPKFEYWTVKEKS